MKTGDERLAETALRYRDQIILRSRALLFSELHSGATRLGPSSENAVVEHDPLVHILRCLDDGDSLYIELLDRLARGEAGVLDELVLIAAAECLVVAYAEKLLEIPSKVAECKRLHAEANGVDGAVLVDDLWRLARNGQGLVTALGNSGGVRKNQLAFVLHQGRSRLRTLLHRARGSRELPGGDDLEREALQPLVSRSAPSHRQPTFEGWTDARLAGVVNANREHDMHWLRGLQRAGIPVSTWTPNQIATLLAMQRGLVAEEDIWRFRCAWQGIEVKRGGTRQQKLSVARRFGAAYADLGDGKKLVVRLLLNPDLLDLVIRYEEGTNE